MQSVFPLVDAGVSETRIFDEQSPSGNDYLAEVTGSNLSYFDHLSFTSRYGNLLENAVAFSGV